MKLPVEFVVIFIFALILISGPPNVSEAASRCEGMFRSVTGTGDTSIRLADPTMKNGQILVQGFTVVYTADSISLLVPGVSVAGELRAISTIKAATGQTVEAVWRLSDSEILVQYGESIQLLRVEVDGRMQGVQKIDSTANASLFLVESMDSNTFILEKRHNDVNKGSDALVYRRSENGRFEVSQRLPNVSFDYLGKSSINKNVDYFATRSSAFGAEDVLYRIEAGNLKPEVVLTGRNGEGDRIFRITGDVFGRGKTGSSSENLREIEVFSPSANGKLLKSVGTIPGARRDFRGYTRTTKSIDDSSFAVLTDHSYVAGDNGLRKPTGPYMRDLELTIATVRGGKLATQLLEISKQIPLDSRDATSLKLDVINSDEIALVGKNSIQIVRKSGTRFELAEVVTLEDIPVFPLAGDRIELVAISPTRFIVQDLSVHERVDMTQYKSQIHVVEKIGSKYKLTKSVLLDGRRDGTATVLADGRIMVDVRVSSAPATPRIQIIDLNSLVSRK